MANWCFYHNEDIDGLVSGAIVNRYLEGKVTMMGYRNGMPLPSDKLFNPQKDDTVYFVDVAPTAEDFDAIAEAGAKLVIIDHHIHEGLKDKEFEGKIEVGEDAACAMAWKHFFPEEDMPRVVEHTSKYDVWNHEDPTTLYFSYGMSLIEQDPTIKEMWDELFEDSREGAKKNHNAVDQLLGMGQIALFYRTVQDERLMPYVSIVEIDGKKVAVMNNYCPDSYSFKPWLAANQDADIDAVMWYYRDVDGGWRYSIRAEKEDCNVQEIAAKHGGGGRANTAGFRTKELLPELA